MISISKDNEDKIIAYLESIVVGQSGFEKLNGEYLYIKDLWIHDSLKNDWSTFRNLMNQTLRKALSVNWVYFNRNKYQGRMSPIYTKERIMRLLERGMVIA